MNNRPVEQALATLVPTHANDLPSELVSLALSLVAQSRSFASSLRPEEEIARPFACSEIACRRLSRKLKLPPLLGHPPCPPRAYKNLYKLLDQSTGGTGVKRSGSNSVPGTPSRAASNPSTPIKEPRVTRTPSKQATANPRALQHTPSKATPLKGSVTNADRPRASHSPQKSYKPRPNGLSNSTIIADAPSWVMTSIRTMCTTLATPAPRTSTWSRPPISRELPPHIFAGASSIFHFISQASSDDFDEEVLAFIEPITITQDKETDEEFQELVKSLLVALYFLVLARRRNPTAENAEAAESPKLDKKTFWDMRQTALTSLGLPSTDRRHRDNVEQWIAVIMEQGWANGQEWFENIPQGASLDEEYLSGEEGEVDTPHGSKRLKTRGGSLLQGDSRKGLLPGLGTMMQIRVDFLSEDRREDYVDWRADMMARIAQMEGAA
ncbi:origin recognition complex, subunit 6 [Aspergillus taichungensis]|uniref:Origin recognition complex, subunit 6 n=1 Tax=Aspergillus taichungensis TaxID=482145 RepID=A0A2J5I2D4_9EURO|nr:origin recognition complex, subunit 6 [Aspergillus taichungensis]